MGKFPVKSATFGPGNGFISFGSLSSSCLNSQKVVPREFQESVGREVVQQEGGICFVLGRLHYISGIAWSVV